MISSHPSFPRPGPRHEFPRPFPATAWPPARSAPLVLHGLAPGQRAPRPSRPSRPGPRPARPSALTARPPAPLPPTPPPPLPHSRRTSLSPASPSRCSNDAPRLLRLPQQSRGSNSTNSTHTFPAHKPHTPKNHHTHPEGFTFSHTHASHGRFFSPRCTLHRQCCRSKSDPPTPTTVTLTRKPPKTHYQRHSQTGPKALGAAKVPSWVGFTLA